MQLSSLFQNHAVLQRDIPLPVWGKGQPGEKVIIRFADREAQATVDVSGNWLLRLPPMKAGGPYVLQAEADSGIAKAEDVWVGEVWICSGQSNMAWTLNQVENEPEARLSSLPQIRLLSITNPAGAGKSEAIQGQWHVATPEAVAQFSAVGGYFGRFLHEELKVPLGLICNAWGGTRVQTWMSREALMQEPEGQNEVQYYESVISQMNGLEKIETFETWERQERFLSPENKGLQKGWEAPSFDDTEWPKMTLPGYWQNRGHAHSGVFWFRKTVQIPSDWTGKELEIALGPIDKHDETWVNGTWVGATGWETPGSWAVPRLYRVAPGLAGTDGRVEISIRVRSHVYAGGFAGNAEMMWLAPVGADRSERIALDGDWRYTVEHDWGVQIPPQLGWNECNPNTPAMLFNHRITPLIPYGFRGVIWYQGESNAEEANLYRRFLPQMIKDWRRAWGAGAFPFIQVQLANFKAPVANPSDSKWAALREAQVAALSLEETGIAITIDIGNAEDIHPRNKRDVGYRLAQCALHQVYGQKTAPLSPLFHKMTLEKDGRVRCTFHHAEEGLVAKDGPLRHFALAGQSRVFHWAEATIEGNEVVVFCKEVPQPYSVRYAWSDNPEGCNLYGANGLPVSPFRSDTWPQ